MYKLNILDKISIVLVLIGAINWGIIGILNKNIVAILVSNSYILLRIIYIAIFVAAINLIILPFRCGIKTFKN
ncbi:DUF378 domain-containing protein [Clostridium celatum]|mgnify:CR=1 FL=1|nr:DUF378 domain-containing protein [Clostridium celatum]MCE9656656.1 DUF378 domain-containing protein [Clostridium celatum]MDU3722057.1 DUF378 domain-containing protein [Clostridium celatum]MDU6296669.1 DUF378 domain-containing protein [Clostridium celatum]MDY3360358.1 DUF378 domain-containing protein [Clostridium celatum]